MSNMIEVAKATVTIVPNMQGAQATISKQMGVAADTAGKAAGTKLGSSMSKTFQTAGKNMQSIGKGLTKSVTAPILAVGAASIKSFNEVKDGLNIVAQKTGAAGKELEAMQTNARNLAKTLPTTFEDAGTAIGEVNTRFGLTGQALEDLSGQFLKFAKVNDTDVNSSIDLTQKALAAFGKEAKDAPALLDAMTKAGQQTGVSMETLENGLIQNGTALQELGLNLNQSVGFMAQLDKSGANSETVMQGLRKALKNAAKDGKPLDQALSELQETIKNGKNGMDGLTASYELFGRSGDQIYGAVKNGTIDFANLAGAASGSKGALDAVFKETLTPAEQFQATLNTMKDAGYELGNTIMTMAAPLVQKLSNKIKQLSAWWSELSPHTQQTIVKVALIAAAVGPVISVIGKLTTGITGVIKILPLLASPAGIAVAAIAGIIAVGVALYKNWDKVKASAKKAWEAIKTAITKPIQAAKNVLSKVIGGIKTMFNVSNWLEIGKNLVSGIWNGIKSAGSWLKDKLFGWVGNVTDWLKDMFGIASPSKVMSDEVGQWLPKGIAAGVEDNTNAIDKAMESVRASVAGVDLSASVAVASSDASSGYGSDNITINVYPTPGMDITALADKIEQKLAQKQRRRRAAYGGA